MTGDIFGRSTELTLLKAIEVSAKPALVAVYGRRRVGKTFLISRFFASADHYFQLTGIRDANVALQLRNFAVEFEDVFPGVPFARPRNWHEALTTLRRTVAPLARQGRKVVLFFDELPWLASRRSGFMQALDHLWNRHLSQMPNVVLVVCGSASNWMIKHVISDKGGLHNRVTHRIRLLPFTLSETHDYLQHTGVDLPPSQVLELYMAFGGVPAYLNVVHRGRSAAQTINRACFASDGPLGREFSQLYRSLFEHHERHVAIVRALGKARSGLTQGQIVARTGLSSGGGLSRALRELEECGFILYLNSYGRPSNSGHYLLVDEFSHFHLRWIDGADVADRDHWQKCAQSQAWPVWCGYAFETVCLKHIAQLKHALGIAAVATRHSQLRLPGREQRPGAQIDLLIDRADNCINLCELKFHRSPFRVDKRCAQDLSRKKAAFLEATGTRKAVFVTLIAAHGVADTPHRRLAVDTAVDGISALLAPVGEG